MRENNMETCPTDAPENGRQDNRSSTSYTKTNFHSMPLELLADIFRTIKTFPTEGHAKDANDVKWRTYCVKIITVSSCSFHFTIKSFNKRNIYMDFPNDLKKVYDRLEEDLIFLLQKHNKTEEGAVAQFLCCCNTEHSAVLQRLCSAKIPFTTQQELGKPTPMSSFIRGQEFNAQHAQHVQTNIPVQSSFPSKEQFGIPFYNQPYGQQHEAQFLKQSSSSSQEQFGMPAHNPAMSSHIYTQQHEAQFHSSFSSSQPCSSHKILQHSHSLDLNLSQNQRSLETSLPDDQVFSGSVGFRELTVDELVQTYEPTPQACAICGQVKNLGYSGTILHCSACRSLWENYNVHGVRRICKHAKECIVRKCSFCRFRRMCVLGMQPTKGSTIRKDIEYYSSN